MAVSSLPRLATGSVATVGTFDGVHRGHGEVLDLVIERARARGCRSILVTFNPHPVSVVRPEKVPRLLTTPPEKTEALAATGLDMVLLLRFTRRLSRYTPERFVREILVDKLGVRELIVGHDHGFGRDRSGDAGTLRALGADFGFDVAVVPPLLAAAPRSRAPEEEGDRTLGRSAVSSSRIRAAILTGELDEAERCLGRPYSISGRVVQGDGRGRALGFPTANLKLPREKLLPPPGIYATRVFVPPGASPPEVARRASHVGALHTGPRPTFEGAESSVEVHLLDFPDIDLYGSRIRIDLVRRIRGIERFSDAEELSSRMALDVEAACMLVDPGVSRPNPSPVSALDGEPVCG